MDDRDRTDLVPDGIQNVLRGFANGLCVCLVFLVTSRAATPRNGSHRALGCFKSPEPGLRWIFVRSARDMRSNKIIRRSHPLLSPNALPATLGPSNRARVDSICCFIPSVSRGHLSECLILPVRSATSRNLENSLKEDFRLTNRQSRW